MSDRQSSKDPAERIAILAIATIATFAALKVGQDFFAPLVFALVTGVILGPFTDFLQRLGLPVALAAVSVLVLGILAVAVLAVLAEPVIWRIVDELPKLKWEIRSLIDEFREIISGLNQVNQEVEEVLGTGTGASAGDGEAATTSMPTVTDALFLAPVLVTHLLIFVGTLFFFLLTRKNIYDWFSHQLGGDDFSSVADRITNSEQMVSRYVLTISIINVGLGATLALLLWIVGLPAPIVWGVAAALFNFVLYLGPMFIAIGLLLAGLVAFNGVMVVVPPAIFLGLNIVESQVVTPSFVGKHTSINPLLVFVSLLFWLWFWGPVGGIIAIPVLLIIVTMLNLFKDDPQHAKAGPGD
ncbi:AI-2E family transporter [Sedimentitalea sp.]|uniref:AI-2E family transporter n=1 Tax=Sedimentitalea sp. TaxID=2048915 RepID=UPI0032993549